MEFLKIDPGLKADLLTAAARHNQTPENLVHEILREYLALDQAAAAGLAEAGEAWAEFEKNGEGVPLEEAAGWLASWGTLSKHPQCRKL